VDHFPGKASRCVAFRKTYFGRFLGLKSVKSPHLLYFFLIKLSSTPLTPLTFTLLILPPENPTQANTKKQKYQRILERKQATHPDLLCRGYPGEFKDYFAHCSALGFEDRPDYRYLKRIFKDLFERQGLEDDGVYDWDVLKRHQESVPAPLPPAGGMQTEGEEDNDDTRDTGIDPSGGGGTTHRTAPVSEQPRVASRGADEPPEPRDAQPPPVRSIISSIRFVTQLLYFFI